MQLGLSFSFRMIRCAKDWLGLGVSMRRHRFGAPAEVLPTSGRSAVVVVQHAAQTLAPMDHACGSKMARFWADESVGQPLVIALGVIMGDEVVHGGPQ